MTRRTRRLRLVAGLALVAAILGAVLVGHAAGLRVLWFASGSMSPAIPAGSLALSRPIDAAEIDVGDVLGIVSEGERVTHRAIEVGHRDGSASIVMRGDANEAIDPAPYEVVSADLVVFALPPAALGLGALAVATTLTAVLLWRRRTEARGRWLSRAAGGTAIALVAVTAVAVPTSAYWTDQVTATSGSFTAGTVPGVSSVACVDAATNVEARWTTVGTRFRYRAVLWNVGAGAAVGSPATLDRSGTGTTATAGLSLGSFGLTTADPAARYEIRLSAVTAIGQWPSAGYAATAVHYATGSAQLRCGNDTATTVQITAISADSYPAGMQAAYGADFITNVAVQTVSGTGEPGARIELRRGATVLGSATVGAGGSWSVSGVTLSSGAASYVATATDPAGNTASDDQTIHLDQTVPTVTQAAPCPAGSVGNPVTGMSGATWCNVTSLSWSMTAADGGSGIALREYANASANWATYTASVAMAEGNGRVMQARATDVAGNVSAIVAGTYYIDGTAPSISNIYPPSSGQLLGSGLAAGVTQTCGTANAVACATFTDSVSGAGGVQYSLRRTQLSLLDPNSCFTGTAWTAGTSATPCVFNNGTITSANRLLASGTATVAYPSSISLLQNFTLILRFRDAAGNQAPDVTTGFSAVLSLG